MINRGCWVLALIAAMMGSSVSVKAAEDGKTIVGLKVVAGAIGDSIRCADLALQNDIYRVEFKPRSLDGNKEIIGNFQMDIIDRHTGSVSQYVVSDFYCHGSRHFVNGVTLGSSVDLQFAGADAGNALAIIINGQNKMYSPAGSQGIFKKLP